MGACCVKHLCVTMRAANTHKCVKQYASNSQTGYVYPTLTTLEYLIPKNIPTALIINRMIFWFCGIVKSWLLIKRTNDTIKTRIENNRTVVDR